MLKISLVEHIKYMMRFKEASRVDGAVNCDQEKEKCVFRTNFVAQPLLTTYFDIGG